MKTVALLVILILNTAVDTRAQPLREEEARKELERLRKELRLPYPEPSPATQIGSRQYCAVDHGGASQTPFRWCEYDDMASCLEVTRNRSNYSCEQYGR
jgi:hypothetical protein